MHLCPAAFSLSCKIPKTFCAMNPPISNLFNSLLYSFLEFLFFFVLQSTSFWSLWQGPCRLRESEFVLTSCHALSCLLATASNSSSILVPFSVSHMPIIFCTKSILHPTCPLFSPNHDLPNLAFSIFPKILTNTLARALSFHFHVLDASFTPQTSILVGSAHHSVRCFVSSLFWSTTVNFSFGFGLSSSQSFQSSTKQ